MPALHVKRNFLLRALSGNLLGDPSESVRAWLWDEGLFIQRDNVRGEGFAYYVDSRSVFRGETEATFCMKRLLAALGEGE
jgi:hypothetical protein